MAGDRELRSRTAANVPKTICRPSRILNSGTKRFTTRKSHVHNTSSCLLLLPPEIRNRIYKLVLGSVTLHLQNDWKSKKKFQYSICCAKISDEDAARSIQTPNPHEYVESYAHRHKRCIVGEDSKQNTHLPLQLDLLLVCSQIHQEAALIPFSENIFAFRRWRTTRHFSRHLIPAQMRAIRTICTSGMAFYEPFGKGVFAGLSSVLAFVEINQAHAAELRDKTPDSEKGFTMAICAYDQQALTSVKVCMSGDTDSPQWQRTDPKLFDPLVEGIESLLRLPLERKQYPETVKPTTKRKRRAKR